MMPVPTNPKLSQVQSEFNAPASAKLSAFYRDGAYVPDTTTNSGVPVSGALFLSDLIGASSIVLALTGDQQPNGACTGVDAPCTATTDSITCTVSGGSSPYTITTEKRPGYANFVVIEGAQSANARTFEYRTTNIDQTITYNSEYRIRVVDSQENIALTDYFAVSNVHTYTETSLSVSGPSTITAEAINGVNGSSFNAFTVSGAGSSVPVISYTVISGTPRSTSATTIQSVTSGGFTVKQTSGTSEGGGFIWNDSWDIRVSAAIGGDTATIDVTVAAIGTVP